MEIKEIEKLNHDKIKNVLELKDESISKDEAHLVYEPLQKDSEFKIDIDVQLKDSPSGIKAEGNLVLLNAKTKKLFKKFFLESEVINSPKELLDYLNHLADLFQKFKNKNLNSFFDRSDFKTTWGSKREKIIKKVVAKIKLK